jgi:hypothetical protein
MNFDNITTVLGILGAYFAVLLVLAVSVETILEPFTSLPWLQKKMNPDDILNDIKEWLPMGSDLAAKAKTIEELKSQVKMTEQELINSVLDLKKITEDASSSLGLDAEAGKLRIDLALQFAALRRKFSTDEKNRITILRVLSAGVGITISILLKVNTFEILSTLFPPDVSSALNHPNVAIGGMILTGLSASAGSSFWHDMLGRVRKLKDAVESPN